MIKVIDGKHETTCTRCGNADISSSNSTLESFQTGLMALQWRPDPNVKDEWLCPRCAGFLKVDPSYFPPDSPIPRQAK
jgi:hypothetical protein